MYQFSSRVRYSEIGPDKHLTLPAIINYFQDCSTFQSEAIGVGLDYLQQEKRAWLLNSWQIVVDEYPLFGDNLTISTWAYDFKGTYGYRNFLLKNDQDKVFAYANSLWIFMDTQAFRMVRIPPEAALPYGSEPKYPMDYAPRKIALPEQLEAREPFPVVSSNIDTNNHVNNGQYVQMAEGFLPSGFSVAQMRAEYRSPAVFGDTITPKVFCSPNLCTVALCSADDDSIYAVVEFTRKES